MPQPNNLSAALSEFRASVQAIRDAYPGLSDEDLADTIDGEALNLEREIIRTLRAAVEREAAASAVKDIAATMTARMSRLSEGAQMLRKAALNAMLEAGIKQIPAPDITAAVGRGKSKVVILDESALPDQFFKVTRSPSKTQIAEALSHGQEVPGAAFSNVEPVLTVRRS